MKYMSMRRRSGQKVVCLYEVLWKADTCSIFVTVCANHFEMCPTVVWPMEFPLMYLVV